MDDNDLLGRLGRRVAALHRFAQRHRLVGGNEGVKDVGAPAGAVLHQHLFRRVLALHKAVEDAHTVGEGRAAHFDDPRVQAEEDGTLEDGQTHVMWDDDAAAALQHVLDRLLEEGRLSEAAYQEEELDVAHLWLIKELS